MQSTSQAPGVSLEAFKRTKIIATIGPVSDTEDKIEKIIAAGANCIRLNFSHGTHEERLVHIPLVRKASEKLGKPVAILQDLQGPKVRLGDFDGIINVQTDEELRFQYGIEYQEGGIIPTQYDLSTKVKPGERLYLFDGKVRTTITDVKDNVVHAKAENDGILLKRKGMNLPDTDFKGDIITKKDMADIKFGATQDIDYVALSFIQSADDINNLRKILTDLGSNARIIAKVETQAAVENLEVLEEIVKASDGVMVARGDLAVETPYESVPVVQRQIIGLCIKHGKISIVATQMMMSMVDMPEPTRAEVSDVATAVFLGADAVMLSDETANGKYPVETVQSMKRIVVYAERNSPMKMPYEFKHEHDIKNAVASAVLTLAKNIDAKAIVAETKSGNTAMHIASQRPEMPVMAVTSEVRVAQQMALVYAVKSYVRPVDAEAAGKLTDWLGENKLFEKGDMVVTVSGRYPGITGATDTIKVRVIE